MRWLLVFLCGISGTMMTPAFGQDAGALLREQERRQEPRRHQSRQPKREELLPKYRPAEDVGPTVVIREVRLTGKVELLTISERAHFVKEVEGQRLGVAGLQSLSDRITARLQQQGRLLARAVLPPQDVTEGVVVIEIVEGALEAILFERDKDVRISEALLERVVAPRSAANAALKSDLESALLQLNDLPGVSVRAKLMAGSAPNTSNLVVGVQEAPIFSGGFWGDNHGNVSTGREQGNALVTLTDVTGFGDESQLLASASDGQTFAQAVVSAPLGASGMVVNVRYAWLDYKNTDATGRTAGLEGTADHAGLSFDYGLIRSRDLNVRLSGGLVWKALCDESVVGQLNDKRAWSSSLAVSVDTRDGFFGGGLTSNSVSWAYGDLDLARAPGALAADAATLRTQGHYHRVNASVARLQYISESFSLFVRAFGQWANKNLDSSEDFALGGPYGVRAYPVGEGRGDMGTIGTIELRYEAPVKAVWGDVQLSTFLDTGHVWVNRASIGVSGLNACDCNEYGLESAGIGLRWTREHLSLSASHSYALGSNPGRSRITGANADGRTDRQQLWLQGALRF